MCSIGSYLVLERGLPTDLFDLVANPMGALAEPIAKQLFKQILSALMYMHQGGICHGDIKLENISFGTDFLVRVSDFGFAS